MPSSSSDSYPSFAEIVHRRFSLEETDDWGPESDNVEAWTLALLGKMGDEPGKKVADAVAFLELERHLEMTRGEELLKDAPERKMAQLFPGPNRRQNWQALAADLELKLPRLGAAPWMQQILGALLIAGLVLMFIWLWWGIAIFWGGIAVVYAIERWYLGFTTPTLGETARRTAALNPELQFEFAISQEGLAPLVHELKQRYENQAPSPENS